MHSFLIPIYQNLTAIEHLKKYCTSSSLKKIVAWAKQISKLQLLYREKYDGNSAIVDTCKKCSLCCAIPVGVGKLSPQDLLYYSTLDIDLNKYYIGSPSMCPFWKPGFGCNLPKNARPMACVNYVCNINSPLQEHNELRSISSRLQVLYNKMPPISIPTKQKRKPDLYAETI
jgi:hypothetical protein